MAATYKAAPGASKELTLFCKVVEGLGDLGQLLADSTFDDPDTDPLYKLSIAILHLRDDAQEVLFAQLSETDKATVRSQFHSYGFPG